MRIRVHRVWQGKQAVHRVENGDFRTHRKLNIAWLLDENELRPLCVGEPLEGSVQHKHRGGIELPFWHGQDRT